METPEVSVIIPVFNSGSLLEETLASVKAQSFKAYEVLIIDNGSDQKKTLSILEKNKAVYKVFRIEEANVSAARNFGIAQAKGKYILPLDSDDKIAPSFLEKSVKLMRTNPDCQVVRTQVKLFGKKSGLLHFEDFSYELLLARNQMVITSLFRKEAALAIGGFDKAFVRAFEDWEFWISLLKNGGKVLTVEEPLFHYRIRKGSRNHSLKDEELSKVRRMIWEKHKALYAQYFVDPKECFEYKMITESLPYKLGKVLTSPFKSLRLMP
jgi:glycosyltransferase involved in cell wall biosynthesis